MPALEQEVLRRLSVFRGGCPAEAVLAVCVPGSAGADRLSPGIQRHLENLIDKGLLQNIFSGVSAESRHLMLESIREYADRKLVESGEADEVQRRHRAWYGQLAEQARQNLRGPDQLAWLNRLEQDIHNFRQALSWCVEHPIEAEPGLRLVAALYWFWHLRSRQSEGCEWLDKLLAIDLQADAPRSAWQARAEALLVASTLHAVQRNQTKAKELVETSLKLFSDIGDSPGVVSAKINLSYVACLNGDIAQSITLAEEVLPVCQANGDRFGEAQVLDSVLGEVAFMQGDYAAAAACHEAALALRRDLRDIDGIAWSSFLLARNVYALGDVTRAQQLYEEARALWRQLGNRLWYTSALHELGQLARSQGDHARAKALFEESLTTARSCGDPYSTTRALSDLRLMERDAGNQPQASI